MDGFLLTLVTGAAAGFAAGLFGIGGGLIFVPALAFVFETRFPGGGRFMHMAVATSLATIAPTVAAAAWAHHRRGAVRWDDMARLTPAIAAGVAAGVWAAAHLTTAALARGFGVYALTVAAQMGFAPRPRKAPARRLPFVDPAGVVIGSLSALIGIGGGTLTTPYLLWRNRPMHHAVGTSAACALPIALLGCAGYIAAGWHEPPLPPWSTGYVYWPAVLIMTLATMVTAPLGAALAHRLAEKLLRRLFAVLLALIGVKMLLT